MELHNFITDKGLNLESLYNICEDSGKDHIDYQTLIDCVKKFQCPFTDEQLHSICKTIDEESTGQISKQDFMETIESYGIATNFFKNSLPLTKKSQWPN